MNAKLNVTRVIDEYRPPWQPERGDLPRIVVVIDPVGGGAADAEQRARDDLALLTAAHLYHLVLRAGGVPVMTRADDRPMPGLDAGADAALRNICEQRCGDLAVRIEFTATGPATFAPLAQGEHSQALAAKLAQAAGADAASDPDTSPPSPDALKIPAAGVTLTIPAAPPDSPEARTYHRDCAKRIYLAIAAFAAAHGNLASHANRPKITPVPLLPDRTAEEELIQTARGIWPDGELTVEQAGWFCGVLRRAALSDRSTIHFEPRVTVENGTVTVGGATNIAVLRDTPAAALRVLGVKNVENAMRLLPEEGRLDGERFGVCVAPMALTFDEPSEAGSLQSQVVYGEPLLLLDRDAGCYLVHGSDGYWGWVRQDAVRPAPAEQFQRYTRGRPAVLRHDITLAEQRMLSGTTLPVVAIEGERVILADPIGGTLEVSADDVGIIDESSTAEQRVAAALRLLYQPYVFGGVSPLGLDCSGLVKHACAQTGVAAARNAGQQFLHGRLVGTRWYRDDIRAGDLLYFISPCGKIYHVGIAISPTHFVHSTPPEVRINSLRPGDRLYSERHDRALLAAKRVN